MPTYEYRCDTCGTVVEAVQGFHDAPLTKCPNCEGVLRKLFGNVGVVFKGSGFYRNDARAEKKAAPSGAKSQTAGGSSSESSPPSSSSPSDSSTSSGPSAKPAGSSPKKDTKTSA